jgi:glucan phosphoethanolaminetransferase (alkaline phosphatase superfamily)
MTTRGAAGLHRLGAVAYLWLATLLAAGTTLAVDEGASTAPPRAIVLVTVDTLRGDYVSANGHRHETTPVFDRLAGSGVNFTRAYSSSAWTAPAMASLFTGLYPTSHATATPPSSFMR